MRSSIIPVSLFVAAGFFTRAAHALSSESKQAAFSSDGATVLSGTDTNVVSKQGTHRPWLEQIVAVDPLGQLTMFLTGPKPFRQKVNGSTPTGPIQIGTPPITMDVIFDTGSDKLVAKTWDTVKRELKMLDSSAPDQVEPTNRIYNHNTSSTYIPEYATVKGVRVPKRGFVAYGSGIAITDEGKDTVSLAGNTIEDFPVSEITADSLAVLHTRRGVSGVLGLQHMKNHTLGKSLFTLFREQNMMTAFGYCRGTKNNGTFIWGDTSTEGTALPVLGQIHWAVSLGDVSVPATASKDPGSTTSTSQKDKKQPSVVKSSVVPPPVVQPGKKTDLHSIQHLHVKDAGFVDEYVAAKYAADVALLEHRKGDGKDNRPDKPDSDPPAGQGAAAAALCPGGKCVAILDTGSNIIAGPAAGLKGLSQKLGVKYDCSNMNKLPSIQMTIGGFKVSLPSSSYVMKVKLPHPLNPLQPQQKAPQKPSYLHPLKVKTGAAPSNSSESLLTQELHAAKTAERLVQDLHEHLSSSYGLDLRAALQAVPLKHLLSGKTLCMPAFVPLDKPTTSGPLWVVGTPLFETYYVRWSWPRDHESPKIFIKDLKETKTCQEGDQTEASATAPDAMDVGKGPGLMRVEGRGGAAAAPRLLEVLWDPPAWEAAEIRYPHWAAQLNNL